MSDRVTQHERMRRYLKHRERVFEARSVVHTGITRSLSAKPSSPNRPKMKMSKQQSEEQRRISRENERLLKSLIRISEKPSEYSKSISRPSSSLPRRFERTT